MVICIFGESCTGKSTLASLLGERLGATVFTGKDFLRLAKDEASARQAFQKKLQEAVTGKHAVYVTAEKEHLSLLPEGAVRVLATADLDTIRQRFASRMRGNLPAPVAAMLERSHGSFDTEPHEFHLISGETDLEELCNQIVSLAK